jgi:hypothetical protein
MPGLLDAFLTLCTGLPDPVFDHPFSERLDRHPKTVRLEELLVRQRRAEIRIPRPDDAQGLLTQPVGQDMIALATLAGDKPRGPIALVASEQPLHLTHAQHELRSGLFLRKPTLSDRTHHMRSLDLAPAHDDESTVHGERVNPTFLSGTNPTLLYCAYMGTQLEPDGLRERRSMAGSSK